MKNLLRFVLVLSLASLLSGQAIAQQAAAPPLKPANDAPANTEVLKLLKAGMPESVVLSKIHTITEKFDTSADALVALKQAGASEAELTAILTPQGAAPAEPRHASAPANTEPTSSGPTLAETMKFIQDKLNGMGKVSFYQYLQSTNDNTTKTDKVSIEYTGVVADPGQCYISYHRKVPAADNPNATWAYSLREVENVTVMPYTQGLNRWLAKPGSPNFTCTSTSPPITTLFVSSPSGESEFDFTDNDLAIRVAKAFARAVALCGGGNKDPF